MIASGDVDAIVTTVRHADHVELAVAALSAGVHVLLEKPAGVHASEVRELLEVAERSDASLGMMLNQRRNPMFMQLKRIIDSGAIGEVIRCDWTITTWWRPQTYYDSSPWRGTWAGEGGGVLLNQAMHQLDLWQWLCGEVTQVQAWAGFGRRRNVAVEDEVTARVEFAGGATGVFVTAVNDVDGTDRLELLGTEGKIVVERSRRAVVTFLSSPEAQLSEERDYVEIARLVRADSSTNDIFTRQEIIAPTTSTEQYRAVFEEFAEHILDGAPLRIVGAEGLAGVALANSMLLSAWRGAPVVLGVEAERDFLRELRERQTAERDQP